MGSTAGRSGEISIAINQLIKERKLKYCGKEESLEKAYWKV